VVEVALAALVPLHGVEAQLDEVHPGLRILHILRQ